MKKSVRILFVAGIVVCLARTPAADNARTFRDCGVITRVTSYSRAPLVATTIVPLGTHKDTGEPIFMRSPPTMQRALSNRAIAEDKSLRRRLEEAVEAVFNGRFEEGLAKARKAANKKSDSAVAHSLAGHSLLGLGRLDEAEDELRLALKLESNERPVPGSQMLLGMTLLARARNTESDSARGELLSRAWKHLATESERNTVGWAILEPSVEVFEAFDEHATAIRTYETVAKSTRLESLTALGPLVRHYLREATLEEAVQRIVALKGDEATDAILGEVFTSLYLVGDRALARRLALHALRTNGATDLARSLERGQDFCRPGRLAREFELDAASLEWLAGLLLVSDCKETSSPAKKLLSDYPELARVSRQGSAVVVQISIQADGTVRDAVVVASPTDVHAFAEGFGEAAITAVRQWRYRPAESRADPAEACATVIVEFSTE